MDRKFLRGFSFIFLLSLLFLFLLGGAVPAFAASQGDWRSYDTTYTNLPAGYVRSIEVIGGDQVWVGSSAPQAAPPHAGGLSKFISDVDWQDNWENYDSITGHLTTNHVWDVDSDSSGNLWVATTRGVRKFDPVSKSSTVIYEDWDTEHTINVMAVAVRSTNDVWFSTTAKTGQAASLWNYKNGSLYRYDHSHPLPGATTYPATFNINCLAIDAQSNLWIGLEDQSASKYDFTTQTWTNYTGQFPNSKVNDIDFDSSGKVWFSTSSKTGVGGGGAYVFDPTSSAWTVYDPSNCELGDYNIMSIAMSPIDGIWFGTTKGAYLWNDSKPAGKKWRVFDTVNTQGKYPTWHLPDNTVYDIKYGNYNNVEYIWFGTGGGGVGRLLADSIRNKPPTASFTINPSFGDCTDTVFRFDATSCWDLEDLLPLLQVRWDWENDGVWDTDWSTVKVIDKTFVEDGTRTVAMEVRDTEGLTASTIRAML
jgi:hypothetical protein